ncbi:MAG TPA: ATP-binding cassette domain-containing protein [Tepidisphaeraceae bacterium]
MPDPIVQVSHLTHRYADRTALADVSLAVNGREIFGFLGPNGSGKTTLFRILSTLIAPQEGEVTIAGLNLRESRDTIRRQIGVVFQSPSLDKQLTAEENLRHHGHLYGLRGRELEDRIDRMLARVGLAERPRELVGTFSGGMRRRVELAKGLLTRPRILLLDEPSTGIDPGARIDLWRYLREIRDQDGVTILVTTHLMDEAEHCDRLAIMDAGKLAACDTPNALKSRIGADVITLSTDANDDPQALADAVHQRFGVNAERVDSVVRIERERGHEFIPQLVEAFVGRIRSVSLGKPTLEDVFIHVTGHGFKDQ